MNFAIELAPEFTWVESDFVHNLLIMGNGSGIWLGGDSWQWAAPPMYTK